ncbi:MAG: Wzz/FepE/Etk N-terminal domain-containing protein [Proteobacteria bacterium]|nr:Wzz/FepE/Etk N-terminal domain-containing protein [Pseudomonadota bacterium]
MTEPSTPPASQSIDSDDDEISLLDLLIVLAKHKMLIFGLPFAVALVAVGYSLTLPNIFTASTKILPPQGQSSGASAMLAQLGGLAGLASGAIKSPNDLYVGMLKSRTVADNLIQRFDLMKLYEAKYPSQVRLGLAGVTNIVSGKDGIITIEVDDKDPKRAADLANAYVDELFKLTKVLAVTEASQRRLFFERQFEQARNNLAKAEADARQALEKGGLVQVEGQGRAIVETTARLRGQITVKEVQIGAMRAFATERNPDLQLAQKELESLKHELARTEGPSVGKSVNAKATSESGIDNLGLLRNVKYHETIYELLAKQFELAKIDEAKDSAVVQVMDNAIEPDRKSKPKRSVIVLLSTLAALFIGVLWAFVREGIARAKVDPVQATRLLDLKRHLAWK